MLWRVISDAFLERKNELLTESYITQLTVKNLAMAEIVRIFYMPFHLCRWAGEVMELLDKFRVCLVSIWESGEVSSTIWYHQLLKIFYEVLNVEYERRLERVNRKRHTISNIL